MRQSRGLGCGCLGCGGSGLAVLVVLGALAWFLVIQPLRNFTAGWTAPEQTTTQSGSAADPQVAAPLTQADVQRFVRVRRDVRAALGNSFSDLQNVWTGLQNGQTPSVVQVVQVIQQAGGSVGAARRAQAAALTREGLSAARYAAIRTDVNRALGLPTIDFARAAQALQNGQLPNLNTDVQTATARERALVAPYRAELEATAPAGLLGL